MQPPRSPTTLVEILRGDRLLSWLTVACAVVVLAPLFATRIVPNVDMGGHAALAGAIPRILRGEAVSGEYVIAPYPMPYTLIYVVMALLSAVLSPFATVKVVVGFAVVLLPLAVMRFSAALGRDPRLGLFAFLIAWENNIEWGFIAFSVGVSVSLFALARLLEVQTAKDALRIWPLMFVLAFTHAQAAALFLGGALAIALVRRPFLAQLRLAAIASGGLWIGLAPWVAGSLFVKSAAVKSNYSFYWPTFGKRLGELYLQSLDLLPGAVGRAATGLAFGALLLAPVVLALLPRREEVASARQVLPVVAYFVLLYWLLPYSIAVPIPQTLVHLRHATLALFAPIWLPPVSLRGRIAERLIIPVVVGLVVLTSAARANRFRGFDHELEPFFRVVSHIPEPSRIAVFVRHQTAINAALVPFLHIGGYVAAATGSFCGTCWNTPKLPVHHRNRLGLPELNIRNEGSFIPLEHAKFYEYVLILADNIDATSAGRLTGGLLEPVYEETYWHLYRVHPEAATLLPAGSLTCSMLDP